MIRLALIILLVVDFLPLRGEFIISGQLELDSTWTSEVYLSIIESFEDLNTASPEFLLHAAPIAADGSFFIGGKGIPAQNYIYRLHVVKRGDPVSSIIIGGREENHVHFLMKDGDSIRIRSADAFLFQNPVIAGNAAQMAFEEVRVMCDRLKHLPIKSAAARQLLRTEISGGLLAQAKSTGSVLIKLFCLHKADELGTLAENYDAWNEVYISPEISAYHGPYLAAINERMLLLELQDRPSSRAYLLAGIGVTLAVILGAVVLIWMRTRKPVSAVDAGLNQLSIQERKVYQLLATGKSNKEISEALHIEVSTVKSHLHRIYSKLGIKSRKEVFEVK